MLGKRSAEKDEDLKRQFDLVPVRILTPTGWITGKLHVNSGWGVADYLEHTQEFFSLADVQLEGRLNTIPVFTLKRSAILFLVVEGDARFESHANHQNDVVHQITCLLTHGILHGRLSIMKGVRLSDYLSRHEGFVLVKDAHFRLKSSHEEREMDHREPAVLLNPQSVIGVSESAPGQ